jgi:ribosomal protein L32
MRRFLPRGNDPPMPGSGLSQILLPLLLPGSHDSLSRSTGSTNRDLTMLHQMRFCPNCNEMIDAHKFASHFKKEKAWIDALMKA